MRTLYSQHLRSKLIIIISVLSIVVLTFSFQKKITANSPTLPHVSIQTNKPLNSLISRETAVNFYNQWKNIYVVSSITDSTYRVSRPESYYDTVSEGIATGMLASVSMDDKQTFDKLWQYTKHHMNNHGLMVWHISAAGEILDPVAATDADEDMAYALIAADSKWGEYKEDTTNLLNNIMSYEVESGTFVLKPGDTWGGSDVLSPSYLSPAYYDIFAQYTGDTNWEKVKDTSYAILEEINNNTAAGETGLIPDWSTVSGTEVTIYTDKDYIFGYKSINTVWRLTLVALWEKDMYAAHQLRNISNFFKVTQTNNIVDGYTVDGVDMGGKKQFPAFVDAAGLASLFNTNEDYKKKTITTITTSSLQNSYYADSYHLITLLLLSNQFPQVKTN